MDTPDTTSPSRAELRRRQANERRQLNAAEVLAEPGQAMTARPSFGAQAMQQALPLALLQRGLIDFNQAGQPRVADYDPMLLAPNPQRARVVDRSLEELAASLDKEGQQEPILARLITETDRARWPKAFLPEHILLILKGHRIYFAQPKTKLQRLRVELMLPQEGEQDLIYSHRALRRVSVKMMHSQSYDIFDKVNLYEIWKQEFALEMPKDAEVAGYFDISRTEAQRIKVVAQMDPDLSREIINAPQRPADEVVFEIANRSPEEQREAYAQFGHMTVAGMRRLLKEQRTPPAAKLTGPGRPRNFVLAVRNEESGITYISTNLTPQQWKDKGGAKAFWKAIQTLVNTREIQDRLQSDLG